MVYGFYPNAKCLTRCAFESGTACTAYKIGRKHQLDNRLFSRVFGGCIQVLDTESEVATGGDPELSLQETLEGPCYVKV